MLAVRDDILKLQDLLLDQEQVEIEVRHHFADGCYARELHIPAGVVLVGAIHKTNHHWVISQGKCAISDESGGSRVISAPYHGQTYPGDKRAIHAIEYTVMTTFHPTDKTDINEIENDIIQLEGGL